MSIRTIAEQAQVSVATVSRALNTPNLVKKSTREKVMTIVKKEGYNRYASGMKSTSCHEVGIVLPNVRNAFFARILEGIIQQTQLFNLPTNLYLTQDSPNLELAAVKKLTTKNVEGVILIRTLKQTQSTNLAINLLKKHRTPFVLIDRDLDDDDYSGIFLSNANAVYDAISLLISQGNYQIPIICGPKDNTNSNQRLQGYRKAFDSHQLEIDEKMIFHSDFTHQSSFNITKKILGQKPLPDYIFSCSNQITLGCIKAINQAGLTLGKHIHIFSFNQLNTPYLDATDMPYIEHPIEEMGKKSISILHNKLVGTKGLIREILPYKIVHQYA